MSTSILKALPGKSDIKRHLPSILYTLSFFLKILLEYVHAVKFAIKMLLPVVCRVKALLGFCSMLYNMQHKKLLCLCLSQNVSKFLSLTIFKTHFCRRKNLRVKSISLSPVLHR